MNIFDALFGAPKPDPAREKTHAYRRDQEPNLPRMDYAGIPPTTYSSNLRETSLQQIMRVTRNAQGKLIDGDNASLLGGVQINFPLQPQTQIKSEIFSDVYDWAYAVNASVGTTFGTFCFIRLLRAKSPVTCWMPMAYVAAEAFSPGALSSQGQTSIELVANPFVTHCHFDQIELMNADTVEVGVVSIIIGKGGATAEPLLPGGSGGAPNVSPFLTLLQDVEFDPIHYGPFYGTNLLVNGDCSSAVGWNIQAGWDVAVTFPDKITATASPAGNAVYQNIPSNLGVEYEATFTIDSVAAGSVKFGFGTNYSDLIYLPGTYTRRGIQAGTNGMGLVSGPAGFSGVADNIYVKQVNANGVRVTIAEAFAALHDFGGVLINNAGYVPLLNYAGAGILRNVNVYQLDDKAGFVVSSTKITLDGIVVFEGGSVDEFATIRALIAGCSGVDANGYATITDAVPGLPFQQSCKIDAHSNGADYIAHTWRLDKRS